MHATAPDPSKWTAESIAAFLAGAGRGLTRADLEVFARMDSAARAAFGAFKDTKQSRLDRDVWHARFRKAAAEWKRVLERPEVRLRIAP